MGPDKQPAGLCRVEEKCEVHFPIDECLLDDGIVQNMRADCNAGVAFAQVFQDAGEEAGSQGIWQGNIDLAPS